MVGGSVLVDGDVDVGVTEDGCYSEEGCEDVWDDVEGVVEVDGEEVLMFGGGEISSNVDLMGGSVFVQSLVGEGFFVLGSPGEESSYSSPRGFGSVERRVSLLSLFDVPEEG